MWESRSRRVLMVIVRMPTLTLGETGATGGFRAEMCHELTWRRVSWGTRVEIGRPVRRLSQQVLSKY